MDNETKDFIRALFAEQTALLIEQIAQNAESTTGLSEGLAGLRGELRAGHAALHRGLVPAGENAP